MLALQGALKKPKITLLFLALAIIIGAITFFQLPKRELPEFTFNIGTITTIYPGATPETVERNVTFPIEDALEGMDGVKEMTSVSAAGVSSIVLQLEDGIDTTTFFSKVRQRVSDTSNDFPNEVITPDIREDIQMGALSSYHVLANEREDLYELKSLVENWKEEVESVSGVRGTIIKGIPDQELVIELDSSLMAEAGLFFPSVVESIENEFNLIPLGTKQVDESIIQLALSNDIGIDALENVYIGLTRNNEPVYLNDLGSVNVRDKEPKDLITYKGTPALSLTVLPEKGVDIPTLQKRVDETIETFSSKLPDNTSVNLFYTQNTIVSKIFKDLSISFILAIVTVVIITILGMNKSSAFIVSLAIPSSILLGLIPLPYMGVDLNQISIIGFIIALGILVDDAIVVNDNIERRYKLGDSPLEGAIQGTKEVRTSIITSTLAVVFTFLPLVFLSGGNGDFIRALPTVLITTIIASTIISLTIVPIYTSWRQGKKRKEMKRVGLLGNQIDKLANWYSDKILTRVVKKPIRISVIGLIGCTAVYLLIPFIPVVFFPSADREEVTVDVILPVGNTIEETEQYMEDISATLYTDESIREISSYVGGGLPGLFGQMMTGTGENTGQLLLRVNKDTQSAEATIQKWSEKLQVQYPEAQIKMTTIEAGPPVGAPITVKVSGPDIDELQRMTNQLIEEINKLEGSGTVSDDIGTPLQTIVYEPIRPVLEDHGIKLREISEQIRLVTDGVPLGSFDDGNQNWDLKVVMNEVPRGEKVNLEKITIPSKKRSEASFSQPELLTFDQLLTESFDEQIQKIPHIKGDRTITIRAYPGDSDKSVLEQQINDVIKEVEQEGYSIVIGGETEARTDFFIEITKLFFVVLFLIYIVMAIQFYSLVTPLLVMSTVYLAISGAIIGLFVTQVGLGFMAMMGIVSLAGIVVRNSIVLIEFIEQRLQEGMPLKESVIEAGRARLRPIILTAFTAIAALLPIAFSGDVLFKPLAISIISGLLFSTVFTVVLVPAFYTAIKQKKYS